MYLLDTNHASRIMDGGDPALVEHLKLLGPEALNLCPVVSGELTFMVEQSARRQDNLDKMNRLLALLGMRDITDDVAREYGRLKAALIAQFGPKDRRHKASITLRNIGVSDNDLWIAAVARHYGLILVSRDADFDRISEVAHLPRQSWLSG